MAIPTSLSFCAIKTASESFGSQSYWVAEISLVRCDSSTMFAQKLSLAHKRFVFFGVLGLITQICQVTQMYFVPVMRHSWSYLVQHL
jgi:hypothetical protein